VVTGTIAGRADISSRHKRAHVVSTENAKQLKPSPSSAKLRLESISVGKRSAMRTNKQSWECVAASSSDYDLAALLPHANKPIDLGPAAVGQVSVWRVRVTASDSTGKYRVDYFIAQSDYSLVRLGEKITIGTGTSTATVKATLDYSRYGESVTAKLPRKCRSSSAAMRSTLGKGALGPGNRLSLLSVSTADLR
jgi:hypothetical protein